MVVGITGHMNLKARNSHQWVRKALFHWMASNDIDLAITCLAPGTDQLFARNCIRQSIPYRVILPCQGYQELFDLPDQIEMAKLMERAQALVQLDGPPSEQAFWEASLMMVDQLDILLAVWDGLPARGLGGTAQVVSDALEKMKHVIHFDIQTQQITNLE